MRFPTWSLALVLLVTSGLASCRVHSTVVAKPKPHPHAFLYYPDAQVYYNPATGRYYWVRGNHWSEASGAPKGIVLGSSVRVSLDDPHPRTHHAVIVVKHPGKPVKVVPGKGPVKVVPAKPPVKVIPPPKGKRKGRKGR